MTTKTKLTVLALAAATFTTASLVASTASAKPAHGFYPKHGPVTGTGTFKQADGGTISGTGTFQIPPKEAGDGTISGTGTFQIPPKEAGGGVISGTGTFHLPPTKWGGNPPRGGDGDGDHDGHHGYGWGYGYGAPVVVEGAPVAVAAPAPVGAPAARGSLQLPHQAEHAGRQRPVSGHLHQGKLGRGPADRRSALTHVPAKLASP